MSEISWFDSDEDFVMNIWTSVCIDRENEQGVMDAIEIRTLEQGGSGDND